MEIIAAIDPVTRLEGHLKAEIKIDKVNGAQQVVEARTTGGLFRGFENLLIGRDPRDAPHITERICGVCPVAHGMASVLALDSAFGVTPPDNARIMRNLVNGANFVESHILHFYLLSAPDFVEGPGMAPWQPNWKGDRRLSKAVNDALVGHYLKAIEMRRKAHEMGALFGGRIPHPPAYVAGGFTANPRPERIAAYNTYIDELITFIQNTYVPDAEYLATAYRDYFTIGRGTGNMVSFGVFELDNTGANKLLSSGYAADGSGATQAFNQANITEDVTFSWFNEAFGTGVNPAAEQTKAMYPKGEAYSWLKAPRYLGKSAEVGPLARMWMTGAYRNGVSVMDRHVARAREALKIALALKTWVGQLDPAGAVYVKPTIPATGSGIGLTEAPRGALGHWMQLSNSVLSRYQVISPTTWNLCPRDSKGQPGPCEEALLGTPVANADEPIEVLRVIHSFDPCLDCATHIIKPNGSVQIIRTGGIA